MPHGVLSRPRPSTCPVCEREFNATNGRQVYCSVACRAASKYRTIGPRYGHPCPECGLAIPKPAGKGHPRKYCRRACTLAANARQFRGRSRSYILARYGITEDDYDRMVARQGSRCAICGTDDPATRGGNWHVDHCHSTNVVRGLLCTRCNIGLGQFMDDPARLIAALRYLGASMVHAKKKSGDPDFDDKVPLAEQVGVKVKGPDGEELIANPITGVTTPDGRHATLEKEKVVDDRPDAKNADVPDGLEVPGEGKVLRGPLKTTNSTEADAAVNADVPEAKGTGTKSTPVKSAADEAAERKKK